MNIQAFMPGSSPAQIKKPSNRAITCQRLEGFRTTLLQINPYRLRKGGRPNPPEDPQMQFPAQRRNPDHPVPGHIHIRMLDTHILPFLLPPVYLYLYLYLFYSIFCCLYQQIYETHFYWPKTFLTVSARSSSRQSLKKYSSKPLVERAPLTSS